MAKIRKFIKLPAFEKRLYLTAGGLLCVMKIVLAILPFSKLNWWLLDKDYQPLANKPVNFSPDEVVRIVKTLADWLVVDVTCLHIAMTAKILLSQLGFQPKIQFGVRASTHTRTAKSLQVEAHAWLTIKGEIIMGDNGLLDSYSLLSQCNKSPTLTTRGEDDGSLA